MKTKTDFVTNSSSCSFVMWGIQMEEYKMLEEIGKFILSNKENKKIEKPKSLSIESSMFDLEVSDCNNLKEKEELDCSDMEDFKEELKKKAEKLGLDCEFIYDYDQIYVGKSPFSMKDEQTLKEFKREISGNLNKLGFNVNPNDLCILEESWYNG